MSKLTEIIAYICQRTNNSNNLSKARLTKLVYLVDWHSAIKYEEQVSHIKWKYNHYGPYVDDVMKEVDKKSEIFEQYTEENFYGNLKTVTKLYKPIKYQKLTDEEKKSIQHILNLTSELLWKDFIELVYSTYPIVTREKGEELDLVSLAKEYKEYSKVFLANKKN